MGRNSDNLNNAIAQLGFYFGEIGQHAFMEKLMEVASLGGDAPGEPAASFAQYDAATGNLSLDVTDLGGWSQIIDSIIGLTDGGTTVDGFLGLLSQFLTEAEGGIADRINADEGRLFTVTCFCLVRPLHWRNFIKYL